MGARASVRAIPRGSYTAPGAQKAPLRRRELWATKAQRNRNGIPRVVLLATLVAAGLRISELCLLDGEDLDFAGRRIYVPRACARTMGAWYA